MRRSIARPWSLSLPFSLMLAACATRPVEHLESEPRAPRSRAEAPQQGRAALRLPTLEGRAPGLIARAVLPADTFAEGPPAGARVGHGFGSQPVQGFSAVVGNGDGSFLALADGFGTLENSADSLLRVHRIRPDFRAGAGEPSGVDVLDFIQLADPDHQIKFAITHHFTRDRLLTGADFDLESMQRAPDGSLYFGDEFGPFLLHTSATGRVLEPPIPLPDPEHRDVALRSPQNPWLAEGSAVRLLNALAARGKARRAVRAPALAVFHEHVIGGDADGGFVRAKGSPGAFPSVQAGGYRLTAYGVNDAVRMRELVRLGVDGIGTGRPDQLISLLRDERPELFDADGVLDADSFDACAERGAAGMRPENTLPAIEAALDQLATTLLLDVQLTADDEPILYHDAEFHAAQPGAAGQARRKHGGVLPARIRDVTLAEIEASASPILSDGVVNGGQLNDTALSPVAAAFTERVGRPRDELYAPPTLMHALRFVDFYAEYYAHGAGVAASDARARAKNAARVRFQLETRVSPLRPDDTKSPAAFVDAIGRRVRAEGVEARTSLRSLDARSLLLVQERFPELGTVLLLDESVNLQPLDRSGQVTEAREERNNTPWLAGLFWPYQRTAREFPARAQADGGLEGMAAAEHGRLLYPMLERPLAGAAGRELLIREYDVRKQSYSERTWSYALERRGRAIGEFVLTSATRGLVIERDESEGDVNGYKRLFEVTLGENGHVAKRELLDLTRIADAEGVSGTVQGDVGLGNPFALPFASLESLVVLGPDLIGVLNDNDYPFGNGRHRGSGAPDDTEFVLLKLPGTSP